MKRSIFYNDLFYRTGQGGEKKKKWETTNPIRKGGLKALEENKLD